MVGFHDGNYKLQDAFEAYLNANLPAYNSGAAASLTIVKGGDFGNRGGDHIYIVVPNMKEDPPLSGTYLADLIVGVATLKDTVLATHREYVKSVFDLMEDADLADYINALPGTKIQMNQTVDGMEQAIGAMTDALRFSEIRVKLRVWQIP